MKTASRLAVTLAGLVGVSCSGSANITVLIDDGLRTAETVVFLTSVAGVDAIRLNETSSAIREVELHDDTALRGTIVEPSVTLEVKVVNRGGLSHVLRASDAQRVARELISVPSFGTARILTKGGEIRLVQCEDHPKEQLVLLTTNVFRHRIVKKNEREIVFAGVESGEYEIAIIGIRTPLVVRRVQARGEDVTVTLTNVSVRSSE